MIDATNITRFNRTNVELEEFLLFCFLVAGKTAATQAVALERWMQQTSHLGETPFDRIRSMMRHANQIDEWLAKPEDGIDADPFFIVKMSLERANTGQYKRLKRAFAEAATSGLDLRTCTTEDLERIHGVGFKTSRFFLVHSRPDQHFAILDTHILRYLRDDLGVEDAPKATPGSSKKYQELEEIFLNHAREMGRDVAELDLAIWNRYSRSGAAAQEAWQQGVAY